MHFCSSAHPRCATYGVAGVGPPEFKKPFCLNIPVSKFDSFVRLLFIAGVNSAVLFFVSLLAAGGDGNASGIYKVRIVGGLFVLGFFLIGLQRWYSNRPGVGIAALALPSAFLVSVVVLIAARMLGFQVG